MHEEYQRDSSGFSKSTVGELDLAYSDILGLSCLVRAHCEDLE